MVNYCVAYGCKNLQDRRIPISFHLFPFKRPEILKLWIEAVRREDWYPSKVSRLCAEHFQPSDFLIRPGTITPGTTFKYLKPEAVPSIFSFSEQIVKEDALPGRKRKVLKKIKNVQNEDEDTKVETITIKIEDLQDEYESMEYKVEECERQEDMPHHEDMDTSTQTKDQETQTPCDNKIFVLRRNIRTLSQKLRRRDMQISKMKAFLKEIRKCGYGN